MALKPAFVVLLALTGYVNSGAGATTLAQCLKTFFGAGQTVSASHFPRPAANAIAPEARQAYVRAHPVQLQPVAKFLVENIRHVGQAEFENAFQKSMESFTRRNPELAEGKRFYILQTEADANSSGAWMLKILNHYRARGTPFPKNAKVVTPEQLAEALKRSPGNSDVVILDDAAYTGLQLGAKSKFLRRNLGEANVNLHYIVPFMTRAAREKIAEGQTGASEFYDHERIETVEEVLSRSNLDASELALIEQNYSYRGGRTLTYFDHKVPDHWSTMAVRNSNNPLYREDSLFEGWVPDGHGAAARVAPLMQTNTEPPYRQ